MCRVFLNDAQNAPRICVNQLDQNSCVPLSQASCAQQGTFMIECGQSCKDKPKKNGKSRAEKCQKKKAKGKCSKKKVAKKCKMTCGKCSS